MKHDYFADATEALRQAAGHPMGGHLRQKEALAIIDTFMELLYLSTLTATNGEQDDERVRQVPG